jgi:hypothetical protein
VNIYEEQIAPKISPARIHDDVANLATPIQVMRPKYPQSALMKLMDGNGSASTLGDAQLEFAPRRPKR